MKSNCYSNSKNDRGYVLVSVAALAVVLLGFTALAVDVGFLYSSRTTMQRIADAAAISGAATFVLNQTASQPATAQQYAMETATGQNVFGQAIDTSMVTVNVNNRIVTVDIARPEQTFFARVLGTNLVDIGVTASAEASDVAVGSGCTKPWFLPNTIFMDPTLETCAACDPSHPDFALASSQVLISNFVETSFASSQIGNQFVIKPQQPANSLAPGQFYAVEMLGPGAQNYKEAIATCAVTDPVGCGECLSVQTGNMVGPTAQGTLDLIGNPADQFFDLGGGNFCYGSSTSNCTSTSPSLVVAPIWDICNPPDGGCLGTDFCPGAKFTGTNVVVKVVGFALVFVEGVVGAGANSAVSARLIGVHGCGSGGGGIDDDLGPFAVPIRLVKSP